jgi:GNAT superfamily N-acetyltransferase
MHEESPTYRKLAFDDEKFRDHLGRLHRVFVAEADGEVVGMMGCYAQQPAFSLQLIAHESGLFITREHRGGRHAIQLVHAFEKWAKEQGIVKIHVGTSVGVGADRTKELYERMGYTHIGYGLAKEI